MRIVVVGDVHAQERKLWKILDEAGLTKVPPGRRGSSGHEGRLPASTLLDGSSRLVLLGDVVHPKSRSRYAELLGTSDYDEFDPDQLAAAERAQESFLRRLKAYVDEAPQGAITILLGNHDASAIASDQGPLRTDDVSHLEWKPGYGHPLPADLAAWIGTWPSDVTYGTLHFAHVGPKPEHNRYDTAFYVENRRRWIQEDDDLLAGTPYTFGFYGHTPVRGGLNLASQGRALLLDTNARGDEYVWCELDVDDERATARIRLRGLFLDDTIDVGPKDRPTS